MTIIRDQHKKLFPYRHDFEILIRELKNLLGNDRVKTFCLDEQGPGGLYPCQATGSKTIPPGSAVLILSNLLDYGSPARERDWRVLLSRLSKKSCRVISLSPANRSPVDTAVCRLSRPQTLFQNISPARHPSVKGFRLPTNNSGVETALMMISPVAVYPCNAWGLFDMHGNVWEWCRDWFGDYPEGPVENTDGSKQGDYRVLRGGSWSFIGRYCRSASRSGFEPGSRSLSIASASP